METAQALSFFDLCSSPGLGEIRKCPACRRSSLSGAEISLMKMKVWQKLSRPHVTKRAGGKSEKIAFDHAQLRLSFGEKNLGGRQSAIKTIPHTFCEQTVNTLKRDRAFFSFLPPLELSLSQRSFFFSILAIRCWDNYTGLFVSPGIFSRWLSLLFSWLKTMEIGIPWLFRVNVPHATNDTAANQKYYT